MHLTKCIKWSNFEAAGLVEYTKWASSTLTSKVVGISRFPNTTRPYILNYKIYNNITKKFNEIKQIIKLTDDTSIFITGIRSLQLFPSTASCFLSLLFFASSSSKN